MKMGLIDSLLQMLTKPFKGKKQIVQSCNRTFPNNAAASRKCIRRRSLNIKEAGEAIDLLEREGLV